MTPEQYERKLQRRREWGQRNIDKVRVYNARHTASEQFKAHRRERERHSKYGLSPELFAELLKRQGNACAICGKVFDFKGKEGTPHIDHEHGGDVRGALCNHCNRGLGHFRDDVGLMAAAIQYLAEPPARGLLTPQLALFELEVYARVPEATRARATLTMNRSLEAG